MSDVASAPRTDGAAAGGGLARNGKLSYLQLPAADVARSAAFYAAVFGWRDRDDGNAAHRAFADASGELIGAWVTARAPSADGGPLPHIYVTDIDATIAAIRGEGCAFVREKYREGDLWVATFRDPAGNTIGIWQFQ